MSTVTQEAKTTSSKETSPVTSETKTMSMLAHLGAIFFGFIPPLVIMLVTKDEIVKKQSKSSLNWQISLIIYSLLLVVVATVLFFVFTILGIALGAGGEALGVLGGLLLGLGWLFLWLVIMAFSIGSLVITIIATVKASQDPENVWKYPFCINLVK
jgi:uncharacterized Tic20 family protein